jgi:hypothetical protein
MILRVVLVALLQIFAMQLAFKDGRLRKNGVSLSRRTSLLIVDKAG